MTHTCTWIWLHSVWIWVRTT